MRQLALIASLVGLLMYAGFVSRQGEAVAATSSAASSAAQLGSLQQALAAAGADLDHVVVTAWVEARGKTTREAVEASLGWKQPAAKGESRKLSVKSQNGQNYLVLRWEWNGTAPKGWAKKAEAVLATFHSIGATPLVTVQVSGLAQTDRPDLAVQQAMNAIGVPKGEQWNGGASSSLTGRSQALPPGPMAVNVQVAARRLSSGQSSRVWAAWPTLLQEY